MHLTDRGLRDVQLATSDKCIGLVESLSEFFPDARWQRCTVHFYRNVFSVAPYGKVREVATMLKAIDAHESRERALLKAEYVHSAFLKMKLTNAAAMVHQDIHETLEYMNFPDEHWRHIRTNNPRE